MPTEADPCLHAKHTGEASTVVLTCVGDLTVAGSSKAVQLTWCLARDATTSRVCVFVFSKVLWQVSLRDTSWCTLAVSAARWAT